ncbi:hypothetical protein H9P43_007158 [Blastocladiella emersonii ATCC 22665]|nr:hypothetical protein H9P43_007158 [Blastocladiella emersonii ATCC 22665]
MNPLPPPPAPAPAEPKTQRKLNWDTPSSRLLLQAVLDLNPFAKPKNQIMATWQAVADQVAPADAFCGEEPPTVSQCRDRVKRLIAAYQKAIESDAKRDEFRASVNGPLEGWIARVSDQKDAAKPAPKAGTGFVKREIGEGNGGAAAARQTHGVLAARTTPLQEAIRSSSPALGGSTTLTPPATAPESVAVAAVREGSAGPARKLYLESSSSEDEASSSDDDAGADTEAEATPVPAPAPAVRVKTEVVVPDTHDELSPPSSGKRSHPDDADDDKEEEEEEEEEEEDELSPSHAAKRAKPNHPDPAAQSQSQSQSALDLVTAALAKQAELAALLAAKHEERETQAAARHADHEARMLDMFTRMHATHAERDERVHAMQAEREAQLLQLRTRELELREREVRVRERELEMREREFEAQNKKTKAEML